VTYAVFFKTSDLERFALAEMALEGRSRLSAIRLFHRSFITVLQ